METGTLGEDRQGTGQLGDGLQVRFDALYAEAKRALSGAANELRALRERAREAHGASITEWTRTSEPARMPDPDRPGFGRGRDDETSSDAGSKRLARQRDELSRLDAAVENLEDTWLFLERGESGEARTATSTGAPGLQMRLVEAKEAERARLAQELHDGPAQALTNAVFRIELLPRILERDPSSVASEVDALKELLERQLDQMRSFIHQLRPVLGDDSGLDPVLRERAHDLTEQTGTAVDVDLAAPELLLDEPQRVVVLRVAQEALQNVRKHAHASHVSMRSGLESAAAGAAPAPKWVLEIVDDGRGFDVADALGQGGNQRHFGLRFMRERAELVGGRLDIDSRPSEGTRIRLTIPVGERR